jgi:hypothetical protein
MLSFEDQSRDVMLNGEAMMTGPDLGACQQAPAAIGEAGDAVGQ